jgi:hypothetical protein
VVIWQEGRSFELDLEATAELRGSRREDGI